MVAMVTLNRDEGQVPSLQPCHMSIDNIRGEVLHAEVSSMVPADRSQDFLVIRIVRRQLLVRWWRMSLVIAILTNVIRSLERWGESPLQEMQGLREVLL